MHNAIQSKFGRGPARWLVMPAVLISVGVAAVSLATGAIASGAITLTSTHRPGCPAAVSGPCGHAMPALNAVRPLGTAPRFAHPMPGAAITPELRARVAAAQAQLKTLSGR
jgi:hypothetical protein